MGNVLCSFCKKEFAEHKIIFYQKVRYSCESCYSLYIQSGTRNDFSAQELYQFLRTSILGQDEQLKKLSTSVFQHYCMYQYRIRNNILLIGPTGSGKTEIARQLSNFLGCNVLIEDMTEYTPAGYRGNSVELMLQRLYDRCNGNIETVKKSIIVLDEFDKLTLGGDYYKKEIQQSVLKLLEGKKVPVATQKFKTEIVDTSEILFIAAGTFTDIFEKENHIGFIYETMNNSIDDIDTEERENLFIRLQQKGGLTNELMGRFGTIIQLNELSENQLYDIIQNSQNSCLLEYETMFLLQGIELSWTEDTLRKICHEAFQNKTGVRGIQQRLQQVLQPHIYNIGIKKTHKKIRI